MAEGDKSQPESIPPVSVTVIGTGDGGKMPTPGLVRTQGENANLLVQIVNPLVAILVRALNLFFVTLSGIITTDAFLKFGGFKADIIIALTVVGVGVIKDFATVFSGMEKRFPLASGSV